MKKIVLYVFIVLILVSIGWYLGNNNSTPESITTVNDPMIITMSIIENFEIAALEYNYRDFIFEENTEARSFWFVPLDPAIKRYAVHFDGRIKIGIDGKEIKVDEQGNVIKITIPKAQLISHEVPLNDTITLIFEESRNTEKFTIGEYTARFNERKKKIEAEVESSDLFKQAQENAKNQLETLFNTLLNVSDVYNFEFVL